MKYSLVLLDTDHIKKYVFATDMLKEIRGASALFDELNRITMARELKKLYQALDPPQLFDPEKVVIYANGGAGLFLVPSEKARKFVEIMQRKYREQTVTGSITGVIEELPDDWAVSQKAQREAVQRLSYKMQVAKVANPASATVLSHALFKYCQSCDGEYATEKYREYITREEYEDLLLCRSCLEKRKKDQRIKDHIPEEIVHLAQHREQEKPSGIALWDRVLFSLKAEFSTQRDLERPRSVNDIGALSYPEHYVGLIYADGNNMGKLLDALLTENGNASIDPFQEVKLFSETVDTAIYKAVEKAIQKPLRPQKSRYFPFDVLLLGGDDLVMLTPAHKAIETAVTIVEAFYNNTATIRQIIQGKTGEDEPTLSVSVVLAHDKYPFGSLLPLAESALKFAKKCYARKKRDCPERQSKGEINFMVVHGSNALDFQDMYSRDLHDPDQHLYRTLRSYSVEDIVTLCDCVRTYLHPVPKAKLHQIREAVSLDRQHAMLETFAALLRAKERDKQYIIEVIQQFAQGAERIDYPWFTIKKGEKKEWYTPLLDAIDLYEFLEKRGET